MSGYIGRRNDAPPAASAAAVLFIELLASIVG